MSGLPVTFSVVSGPGTINYYGLTITGTGTIVVAAHQAGDIDYAPAMQVTRSTVVSAGPSSVSLLAARKSGQRAHRRA